MGVSLLRCGWWLNRLLQLPRGATVAIKLCAHVNRLDSISGLGAYNKIDISINWNKEILPWLDPNPSPSPNPVRQLIDGNAWIWNYNDASSFSGYKTDCEQYQFPDQQHLLTKGKSWMKSPFVPLLPCLRTLRNTRGWTVNFCQLKHCNVNGNRWQTSVCAKKGEWVRYTSITKAKGDSGRVWLTNCWIDKRNNGQQSAAITVVRRATAMAETTQQQCPTCRRWHGARTGRTARTARTACSAMSINCYLAGA